MTQFTTNYKEIIAQVLATNPNSYSRSRNFLNGHVTKLSPYLTHGVITLDQVRKTILSKYSYDKCEKLIFELAWKEFFLRVWESKGDLIFDDLKNKVEFGNDLVPKSVIDGETGIEGIDGGIKEMYETGYMHNHQRMWTASVVTNIAKSNWKLPAKWLYYHLLDGDLASNTLSWQWICGAFSSKKYFANQENINKYSLTNQKNTFLNVGYDEFDSLEIPESLKVIAAPDLECDIESWAKEYESAHGLNLIENLNNLETQKIFLFHPWSLSPNLGADESFDHKILILEPSHFAKFPISRKRLNFILDLSKNIIGLKVFVGEINTIESPNTKFVYQKYPAISHWSSIPNSNSIPMSYLFPKVIGYYSSFMSYYKQCQKNF
jgi:deoxyribodipyrimidine photo-lyase